MMNALKLGGLPLAVRKAVLRHATAGRRRGYVRVPVVGKHMCKGGRGRAARSPRAKGCRLAERVVRSLHGGGAAVQRSSRLLATGRSRRHMKSTSPMKTRRLSLSAGASRFALIPKPESPENTVDTRTSLYILIELYSQFRYRLHTAVCRMYRALPPTHEPGVPCHGPWGRSSTRGESSLVQPPLSNRQPRGINRIHLRYTAVVSFEFIQKT